MHARKKLASDGDCESELNLKVYMIRSPMMQLDLSTREQRERQRDWREAEAEDRRHKLSPA